MRLNHVAFLLVGLLAACDRSAAPTDLASAPTQTPSLSPSPSMSPSPSPLPSQSLPAPPSPAQPLPRSSPAPAGPSFDGTSSPIDAATRARMSASWREGCPVPIEHLRILRLDHWGFDGAVHKGELVVHMDQANGLLKVFKRVFDARFAIERMELVDVYGADDDRSMDANNTSAFNCREVSGRPGVWSQHSYGRAVDINPIQNPYIGSDGHVSPSAGAAYTDRSKRAQGMIHRSDAVTSAFRSIGWGWGGNWSSSKDYQHFSSTGR